MAGPIDPERWVREQEQRSAQLLEKAEQAKAELAQTTVTQVSRDQVVTLTVNPGGVMTDLRLSPRAEEMSATQIASTILDTYRRASARAAGRMVEIMTGLLGAGSDSMNFMRSTMPLPVPDDEEPSAPPPARPPTRDDDGGYDIRWQ